MGLEEGVSLLLMMNSRSKYLLETLHRLSLSLFTQKLWRTSMWLWVLLLVLILLRNQVVLLSLFSNLALSKSMKEMSTLIKRLVEQILEKLIKILLSSILTFITKNLKLNHLLNWELEYLMYVKLDLETDFEDSDLCSNQWTEIEITL